MKKMALLTGMLVMVLVFGMAVVGCDDGSDDGSTNSGGSPLNGTWVQDNSSSL